MNKQKIAYTTAAMTKEQLFYAYKELAHEHDSHILLESGRGGALCMAGIDPLVTLRTLDGDKLQLIWRDGTEEVREGNPLELLNDFVKSYEMESIPGLPDFQGGAAGFISYDYVRTYENIPVDTVDDLDTPDLFFYLFDRWVVLDVKTEMAYFMTLPGRGLEPAELEVEWMAAASEGLSKQVFAPGKATEVLLDENDLAVSVTGPQFEQMVRDVQDYIASGDVVQVNLSVRQSKALTAHPLDMYEAFVHSIRRRTWHHWYARIYCRFRFARTVTEKTRR